MKAFYLKLLVVLLGVNLMAYYLGYYLQYTFLETYRYHRIMDQYEDQADTILARFDALPPETWQDEAKKLEKEVKIPVYIDRISTWDVMEYRKEDLYENRVVYHGHYINGLFLDLLLKRGLTVLTLGPLPEPFWFSHLDILLRLVVWALCVAGAIATVMLPYKRRLEAIKDAMAASVAENTAHPVPVLQRDTLGELAETYNRTTQALEQWRSRQEQVVSDQRDLMHAIAHELRGPLARADFALELLRDAASEDQRRKLTNNLGIALSELEELVREVLGYARLQHGTTPLNPEAVALTELVDEVIAKVKTLYPNITFESDHEALVVRADRRLLERALLNLVKNAACYARRSVQVRWSVENGNFRLSVEDDGPGVPAGERDSVFMPFVRLDPSRSRDSGGVGLGLAIVKSISERHAGRVLLGDSQLGGARFELDWPAGLAA